MYVQIPYLAIFSTDYLRTQWIVHALFTTVSIRIVADCVAVSYQFARKVMRAGAHDITSVSAIIFIQC
jgi:uncharacterized protein YqgC (DUF456 family)